MRAYKCDRCERFYSQTDRQDIVVQIGMKEGPGYTLDLCDKCIEEITEWLSTGKICCSRVAKKIKKEPV